MKKGYCLVNSILTPEKLYPEHKIIYGDNVLTASLVNKFNNIDSKKKEKYVVVFYKIPEKEIIKNIVYPFIIFTTKKTPKWLSNYVITKDNKIYIDKIINKIINSKKLVNEEETFLKKNIRLLHYIIAKNIHKLFEREIPSSFNTLEKLAVINDADIYLQLLVATVDNYVHKKIYV